MMSTRDQKDLKKEIAELYSEGVAAALGTKKDKFEYLRLENREDAYAVNGELTFIRVDGKLFPFINYLAENNVPIQKIVVDMGAVRFMMSGADVMRPGIVKISETIEKDDIVAIVEETHGKPLSIGRAMYDAAEIQAKDSGKVVKTIHHFGDKFYEFAKTYM